MCGSAGDFYRRKTLYFLSKVKDCVAPIHWELFRCQINLKTNGSISWKDIENATLPLYGYGLTRPNNIAWESDMDDVICDLKKAVYSVYQDQRNYNPHTQKKGSPPTYADSQLVEVRPLVHPKVRHGLKFEEAIVFVAMVALSGCLIFGFSTRHA